MLGRELLLQRIAHVFQVAAEQADLVLAVVAQLGAEAALGEVVREVAQPRSGRKMREFSSHSTSASEASSWPPTVAPYSQRWRSTAAVLRWSSISICRWPMRVAPRKMSRSPVSELPWRRSGRWSR
jgi:hypothetical protein